MSRQEKAKRPLLGPQGEHNVIKRVFASIKESRRFHPCCSRGGLDGIVRASHPYLPP